jgi:SAM-dependent methyltransferase
LFRETEALTCPSGHTGGSYIGGIPCFIDPEGYRGEFTREEMRRLNRLAEEVGWQAAMEQAAPKKGAGVLDERRADFRHLWDLRPDAVVLEMGDRWGSVAAALGTAFARVTAVENFFETARFVDLRVRQMSLSVETICASFLRLPLPPGQFDAVVAHDFRNASESEGGGGAGELQLRFLRSAREMLKPSGFLCLGVENRFGWHRMLRRARANDNRGGHTRSLAGYRRLFREAGYGAVRAFHSWNGCHDPSALLPLSNRAALAHFAGLCDCGELKRLALRAAASTGLWAQCAPEVFFLAEKG